MEILLTVLQLHLQREKYSHNINFTGKQAPTLNEKYMSLYPYRLPQSIQLR
jgi:hypothetical protein